jgi:hypothetical protein
MCLLTTNLRDAYYSGDRDPAESNASSSSSDYNSECRQSYHSLLAGNDLFRRGRDLSRAAHRPRPIFATHQV